MLRSEERFCAGLRASFFLLCLSLVVLFTPPPRGRGWILGFVLLGFVGFALLVHRRLTLAQQGLFRALLVSFPYPVPKKRTQGRTGPSLVFTVFSWCALGLAVLTSPSRACNSPPPGWGGSCRASSHCAPSLPLFYLRGLRVDQSLLFQLPYVFCNRVSAHSCVLADPSNAGPALVGFPVLAEHQVGVD